LALNYVSTLPDIIQSRNTAFRLIETWEHTPQGIIDETSANMAACMCKGKGTSLQTPTVI